VLTAIPDRRRRPSDGLVVEASIVARLFRMRLLRLDATVVIAPADVTTPTAARHDSRPRPSARSLGVPPHRPGPAAGRLAEAVRRIDDSAAILAEVRPPVPASRASRNGGARRW
jgi:hypothetical protein